MHSPETIPTSGPEKLEREEAEVSAYAEKPVRDLAREAGVNQETKEVFDIRAEQRGEEALQQHIEQKESVKVLFNPELAEIRSKLVELDTDIRREFGEGDSKPELTFVKFSEDENLASLSIRGLYENRGGGEYKPQGILGKKFEKDFLSSIELNNPGFQGRREINWEKTQEKFSSALVNAYKYNPEARELLNKFIQVGKEEKDQYAKFEELIEAKGASYKKGNNINELLYHLNISKRAPDDLDLSHEAVYEVISSGDESKVEELIQKIVATYKAFDNLELTEEKEKDIYHDLSAIKENLEGALGQIDYNRSMAGDKDIEQKIRTALKASEAGSRSYGTRKNIYSVKK